MEGLNPALGLAMEIRRGLESGESIRGLLMRQSRSGDPFSRFCRRWIERHDRGGDLTPLWIELKSPHRRVLLRVLERGLKGDPIHASLMEIEKELAEACRIEMDRHLALLPFRLMVPLLFLLFPAVLLLILAPFLDALAAGFGP
jgi:hypothetical protein